MSGNAACDFEVTEKIARYGAGFYENAKANYEAGRFECEPGSRFHDARELLDYQNPGHAAIVIGGGPSLRDNYQWITRKTMNIATDCALRFCMEKSLSIDWTLSLEFNAEASRFFEGLDTTGMKLLAPITLNPKTVENWKGEIYWFRFTPVSIMGCIAEDAVIDELADELGDASGIKGYITPFGNVGTTSVGVAMSVFKCQLIMLTGFDFSWTTERYAAADHDWIKPPAGEPVEGLDMNGNPILFNATFRAFRAAMIQIMALYEDSRGGKIYNCSGRGILNFNAKSFEEVFALHGLDRG